MSGSYESKEPLKSLLLWMIDWSPFAGLLPKSETPRLPRLVPGVIIELLVAPTLDRLAQEKCPTVMNSRFINISHVQPGFLIHQLLIPVPYAYTISYTAKGTATWKDDMDHE